MDLQKPLKIPGKNHVASKKMDLMVRLFESFARGVQNQVMQRSISRQTLWDGKSRKAQKRDKKGNPSQEGPVTRVHGQV